MTTCGGRCGAAIRVRSLPRACWRAPPPRRRSVHGADWRRLSELPNLRWVAAATACLLMLAAGIEYRERETRLQGEAAKQQLVEALRIAGSKLNQTREKVRELNLSRREL